MQENSRTFPILSVNLTARIRQTPIPFVLGAVVILVFGILALVTTQSGGSSVDFSNRQKVSAHANLHFSFPALMNESDVVKAMTVPEGLEGQWSWDGGVAVFDPASDLKAGAVYTFHLPRTAKKYDNEPLGDDLDFVFTVSGPPTIVARIPSPDTRSIDPASHITMIFDRPMVSLTQIQSDESTTRLADWPVTVTPPVEGTWHWLSTVAIAFVPKDSLMASTKYTVHVPAGIKTIIGDSIEHDIDWSFETKRPEVVTTDPVEGYRFAGPKTPLSLTFNQEMDPATVKDSIMLYDTGSGSTSDTRTAPTGKRIPISKFIYGTMEVEKKKMTDKKTLIVVPASPLALNTHYALYVAPGTHGLQGNLGSASGFTLHVTTVGTFGVESAGYEYGGVRITFKNPVDKEMLEKHARLSPALPKDSPAVSWNIDEWNENRIAVMYPEGAPSTKYTVMVDVGMTDLYGQHLKEPYTFTFSTPEVPSKVFIHSNGDFGIFERGKAPVYYLNNVNVKTMDVEFAKLALPEFLSIRSRAVLSYGNTADNDIKSKEGYQSWSITPPSKHDVWAVTPFDVEKKVGQSLAPGIYTMQLSSPEYKDYNGQKIYNKQFFVITNIALTLKYSGDHALVWATDMETGAPVADAAIVFHSLNGNPILNGKTDAQGFFETAISLPTLVSLPQYYEPEFWVTAEKDGDFTFVSSQWNDGIRPNNFDFQTDFRNVGSNQERVDAYLYTERPLYSAGDTVHFKGMVRLRDWSGKITIPGKDTTAIVTVTDPSGTSIWKKTLPINAFGSVSGDLPIDAKAPLGYYGLTLSVMSPGNAESVTSGYFSVLAYRKPEYKVEVTTAQPDYFNGQTVQATIEGAYYFGAPLSNAPVTWRAISTDYFFNKFTDGWYSFALDDAWCWYDCSPAQESVMEGKGTLDATGHMTVNIPMSIDNKAVSQILSIEADITDLNNQSVSNSVSVPVHKANLYVGVRNEEYVVTPGSDGTVAIVTVKPDGSVMPNQSVRVQLYSRTWNSIRKKGVDGQYYYDNEHVDTFIREQGASTNEQGKGTAKVRIPSGGEYRIVVIGKDADGREVKAGTSMYAFSSTYINWPHSNNDRIDVIADKPEYKVGDTAHILIKSPYSGKGVQALVTVEREQIITKKVITIDSSAQSIDIPITQDLLPTAYVSVVVVKPRIGETFNENGLDTGAPAYKIGYAKLSVDTTPKKLNISVKTDKEKYLPGEKVTVTLTTTDSTGKAVPAEVSLGTVDMSLLALSGFEMPDLVKVFYSERGLGVYTSQMLSFLVEQFKPGSKGGGGADPESRKRGNFKDTAYWNPSIVTDANGSATVSFSLPDNLTTWQLLAIGQTKQQTYGAAVQTIIATKRVILRPVRPRFAVHGDTVELGAIVQNFLPDTQEFTVTLSGKGFTRIGNATQTVTLAPNEQKKMLFPVKISPVNSATFSFKADNATARDEIEETIPVYPFGTMQSMATTGIVDKVAQEKVHVPSASEASTGSLTVTVSPSIATYLTSGLEYLEKYPYGCTEQTVSAFLPSVALATLQGFDAFHVADKKTLDDIVTKGLQRVYTFQRSDGGFGYWQDSPRSYAYLSAYVLSALHRTEVAGYKVDSGVMDRTAAYLNTVLREQTGSEPLDLATRASILFTLSEVGKVNISLLNNLYPLRAKMPLFSQAQLARAYQNLSPNTTSTKATDILTEVLQHAKVDGRGTHFEEEENDDTSYYASLMHTNERTTAIVLRALIQIEPDHTLIPAVMRYLLSVRTDGHWDTTQSTVETLLALTEYLHSTQELDGRFTAGVALNGKKAFDWTVTKDNILSRKSQTWQIDALGRGKDIDVNIAKEGVGRLYYDLVLSSFATMDHIAPAEEGISITRTMTPLPGQKKEVTVGNIYDVTLTITVPEDRQFVAVESPVPAGMEIVDSQLKTTQKSIFGNQTQNLWSDDYWQSGLWRFNHTEFRDDQAFLFADSLPTGVYQYHYLVRATTSGTYRYRPARVSEMYFPEIFGQTGGDWFTIKE